MIPSQRLPRSILAVALALWLEPEAPRLHAAVGLSAFLGHVYPVWLKLHGGKGVDTALGVLVAATAVTYMIVWMRRPMLLYVLWPERWRTSRRKKAAAVTGSVDGGAASERSVPGRVSRRSSTRIASLNCSTERAVATWSRRRTQYCTK